MTLAQVEYAEQRMQQQWHDLVMAEQAGKPSEILEQMYTVYILLAERFNATTDEYQRQRQNWYQTGSARRPATFNGQDPSRQEHQQHTKLAS
jgi:hypothetical protein